MMYLSILLIATAFGMYIQSKLKEKLGFYARFSKAFGLSGKEVAERMLAEHGLTDIRVATLSGRTITNRTPWACCIGKCAKPVA
jgi:Zn-dependent membrane protease YugP